MSDVDATPSPGVERRTRRRGLRDVGVLGLVATCGWLGMNHAPPQFTDAVSATVARLADDQNGPSVLPLAAPEPVPASERDTPVPSAEEAPAPLGTPPPAPATTSPYAFSATGTLLDGTQFPVRWSPCRPIHYVVDLAGAPVDFSAQVDAAVAKISGATGLQLVNDGVVVEAADPNRDAFQPEVYGDRWAPVLIRFSDGVALAELGDDVAGVAIPTHVTDSVSGQQHIVSGAVYLDLAVLGEPDVAGVPRYIPVLEHELGHLVGLAHVDDPSQLMYPELTEVVSFQPGDLAGLATAGNGECAPAR